MAMIMPPPAPCSEQKMEQWMKNVTEKKKGPKSHGVESM